MIKTSNEDEEKAGATRALWMLAFDNNKVSKIRQEKGAMDILHQLQQSKNSEVQKAAEVHCGNWKGRQLGTPKGWNGQEIT